MLHAETDAFPAHANRAFDNQRGDRLPSWRRFARRALLQALSATALLGTLHAETVQTMETMGGAAASAEKELPIDKWQYHFFNPAPRKQMREMSTDRPDQTESPYTVDAGHFQVESDLVNATFDTDRSGGGKVRSTLWSYGSVNLKAGLLNNVDIQFVVDTFVDSRVEDRVARTVEKASGFGDVQTRLKINL